VLSACSHAGLVHEACYYFTLMKAEYRIKPNVEHYQCVVDLLGRVGRVEEAEELIRDMPYVPGAMAWSSLLGACKVHGNVGHGKDAAGHVLEFNSRDVAAVSMLSTV
jgi:pentatricopeptide repeat protein